MKDELKPAVLNRLSAYLSLLPGIGPKTATRLAFFMITQLPIKEVHNLADLLKNINKEVKYCSFCNVLSSTNPCAVCADLKRNKKQLLIVESSLDVYKIEETEVYNGLYYVLKEPPANQEYKLDDSEDFVSKELLKHFLRRVCFLTQELKKGEKLEVIFGLPVEINNQGIFYTIKEALREKCGDKIVLSRLAVGLSIGADIEFVDPQTLTLAINNRQKED